jgi:transcriptional regulator with XRE-family HTH domain
VSEFPEPRAVVLAPPWTLAERINVLVKRHGSLRAVARVTGIDVGYLSRLRAGERVRPLKDTLRRLGLKRVVTYELLREDA